MKSKMKMNELLKSNDGIGLVAVLIIGTILASLILSFSSYMYQQAKLQKNLEGKKDYSQLQNAVTDSAGQTESLTRSESLQYDSSLPTPTP